MKNHKPLIIMLLTLISTSIFAQDYDLDSLVKTHKKVAVLPVRVMYSHENLNEGETIESVVNKEYTDGFLIQNSIFNFLKSEKKQLKVEIQPVDDTNKILADNKITLEQLKEFSPNLVADALQVDAIIEIEMKRKSYFYKVENSEIINSSRINVDDVASAAAKGFLTGNPLYLVMAAASTVASTKSNNEAYTYKGGTINFKMKFIDGKTSEIIKTFTGADFEESNNFNVKIIEKFIWSNFKKSSYYRK